jgi:hypothetical protein
MAIIIEGMDSTGKSTLARTLAPALKLTVKESEGPPANIVALNHRVERYQHMVNVLFVRHPCVSHNIYNIVREHPFLLDVGDFYSRNHIFIYCSPLHHHSALHPHVAKSGEDPQFTQRIDVASDAILWLYQQWALAHAHIIYRIGDDAQRIIQWLKAYQT